MTRSTIRPLAACMAALLLAACATTPRDDAPRDSAPVAGTPAPAPEATVAPATPPAPPPHDELYTLAWAQTAVEYDVLNRTIYGAARAQLDRALADKSWDALPPSERARTGVADVRKLPPAIILDIDETVLENSPFNASLVNDPIPVEGLNVGEYRAAFSQRWHEWTERAAAPRMAGAKEFLDYAVSRGVAIFYVTNRACGENDPQCEEASTCRNVVAQDLPLADCEKNLLLRFEEADWRTDREKGTRRIAVGKTHRLVMMFGDNLGDFVDGIYGKSPASARADRIDIACGGDVASWWGERWMVLPNPMYGSWVDAVDAIEAKPDDKFEPALVRAALMREKKRAALVGATDPDATAKLLDRCNDVVKP